VDPVGYLDMLALERDAAVIVTDSGGVQEEACMVGTPCVTVRRNTEREITVEVGANRLVPAETSAISETLHEAVLRREGWQRPERWDDKVSARVVAALESGVLPLSGY
jgi:UDP-N-acetylglucosamine 2-epimerase (non-hydrolysing)